MRYISRCLGTSRKFPQRIENKKQIRKFQMHISAVPKANPIARRQSWLSNLKYGLLSCEAQLPDAWKILRIFGMPKTLRAFSKQARNVPGNVMFLAPRKCSAFSMACDSEAEPLMAFSGNNVKLPLYSRFLTLETSFKQRLIRGFQFYYRGMH